MVQENNNQEDVSRENEHNKYDYYLNREIRIAHEDINSITYFSWDPKCNGCYSPGMYDYGSGTHGTILGHYITLITYADGTESILSERTERISLQSYACMIPLVYEDFISFPKRLLNAHKVHDQVWNTPEDVIA